MGGLYGPEHEIDKSRGLARARVLAPIHLDFAKLHACVQGNGMMNIGRITLVADVSIEDRKVRILPTGQVFRLQGPAPGDPSGARRRLTVLEPFDRGRTSLELAH